MGLLDSLIVGAIGGYNDAKNRAKQQAYLEMSQLQDRIKMMQRVCEQRSNCLYCNYGTSPNACEINALIDIYNEKMKFYISKGLIKAR